MRYPFLIVDVFTDRVFGGNPLAVMPHAEGLTAEAMQRIAREFNFAESTFVLPPATPAGTRRVRIFTPKTELPFAGHPTVGTAAALAHLGELELRDGAGRIVFEEGVGPVTVDVETGSGAIFSRLTLHGAVEMPPERPDVEAVAGALSLPRSAVLECWDASVGVPFCFVRLADAETVDAASLDRGVWAARLRHAWAPALFFFAGDLEGGGDVHARMFAPGFGIDEDPATGSAVAALAGCLALRHAQAECAVSFTVRQGVAMGRPSHIRAAAAKRAGKLVSISVGGQTAIFAQGTLELPP